MDYFLIKPDGEITGTFSIEQIRAMLHAQYIGPDTRYWHEGISGWQPIDRVEESLQFEPPAPAPAKNVPAQKIAAVLKAVPPAATKLEKVDKKTPSVPVPGEAPAYVPTAPRSDRPPTDEDGLVEDYASSEAPATAPVVQVIHTKSPRLFDRILFLVFGALIALAIDHGADAANYISDAMASKVTLSGDSTFVLLDPATIKSFEQDLQDSPTVESLKNQIAQTADTAAIQRLNIGIQTERTRHADDIRQQYLRSNSAEFIDPATYRIVGYYDRNGDSITPSKDQPVWVAINYKDHTVYAFKAPDSTQKESQ